MGWFSTLLTGATVRDDGRINEAEIARAIEMVVEHTDPRLRMVSGYRRKLRKPVIRSLLYLNQVAERIPGPVEVNRKAFGADHRVNALFASVDAMRDVFSLSDTVRQYLDSHPGCETFYGSLGMVRDEKGVFGMETINGILRKGVAQVAVNYSGHWVGVAGDDLAQIRDLAKWRGMQSLCISALEHLSALRVTTAELKKQQSLLEDRLRQFRARGDGLEPSLETGAKASSDPETIRDRIEENARQLNEAEASLATLDGYLAQVSRVLAHPSRYLGVKLHSVSVNRMGIKAKGGGAEVVTAHIKRPRQPSFDMVLVHFPRAELRDPEYYHKRAKAYLHALDVGR